MLKKLVLGFTAVAVMGLTSVAMAAGLTAKEAQSYIEAARAYVPAGAGLQSYEMDNNDTEVEIKFFDNATLREYKVEYAVPTQVLKEVTIKGTNSAKSTTIVKTEEDVKGIILEAYPNATDIVVKLDKDGQYAEYEATFNTPEFRGEVEVNPVTGAFGTREHKYVK